MKKGETIKARTHAELLNKLFGTNYKQWYKCTYNLKDAGIKESDNLQSPTMFVWMVCLDNSKNAGHCNKLKDNATIIEQFDKPRTCSEERFEHGLKIKKTLGF